MADMDHAQKRATGLKMLKQYQQHKTSSTKPSRKKQGMSDNSEKGSVNEQNYSFFTGFSDSTQDKALAVDQSVSFETQHMNYNGDSTISVQCEQKNTDILTTDSFKDVDELTSNNSASQSVIAQPFPTAASMFVNNGPKEVPSYSEFFDSLQKVEQCSEKNVLVTGLDDKNVKITSPVSEQVVTDSALNFLDFVPSFNPSEQVNSNIDTHENTLSKNSTDFDTSRKEENHMCSKSNSANKEIQTKENISQMSSLSSTESLRQLSLEMNSLMDDATGSGKQHMSEIEQRNQELAALLGKEQQRSEQFQLELKEYQLRVSQLQVDLERQQTELQARQQRELSTLQEQLQFHIQTVGILVGEKTELAAALSQSQQTAKQKAAEVEEMQVCNKALQNRIHDLEKEISVTVNQSHQFESSAQDQSKELNRLKLEKQMLTKQLQEVEEEMAEFKQNLNMKSNEVNKLQQLLQEKQSHLDLAQLRVQQLSSSDSPDMEQQLEAMHQKKVGLENQVAELQQTVKALGSERDQVNTQYQEYLQNVNNQMKNMADKLAATVAENEKLTSREQSLVKHLSDLEKQLQHQQEKMHLQQKGNQESSVPSFDVEQFHEIEKRLSDLQIEKKELESQLEKRLQENTSTEEQLKIYINRVEDLETLVETLKADQPDTTKLLAAMESDKVAAALAVGQNQKLKVQLGELEEGFIQMSNSKLELTEQLSKEQHLSKELSERLTQQELEISELRNQLQKNEMLLQQTQSKSEQQSWQILQQNQIADQMRHYEAQGQITEVLQKELRAAKNSCENLRAQNNELRMQLAQVSTSRDVDVKEDGIHRDELVDCLSASIRQLEMERDELLDRLHNDDKTDLSQTSTFIDTGTDIPDCLDSENGVDAKEYTNMKEAMRKLEERFTKTMGEVAELSDEKQRLEHLVLQLQGETETIGEYIALYQMQRSVLRQRAQEKDEQLAHLARDREEVKIKLNELNRLIGQLVSEKDVQQDAIIHSTAKNTENLCNSQIDSDVLVNGDINSSDVKNECSIEGKTQEKSTKNDTADKIIALLSEIETSTLVEPRTNENFHPCPWCSGRLITV